MSLFTWLWRLVHTKIPVNYWDHLTGTRTDTWHGEPEIHAARDCRKSGCSSSSPSSSSWENGAWTDNSCSETWCLRSCFCPVLALHIEKLTHNALLWSETHESNSKKRKHLVRRVLWSDSGCGWCWTAASFTLVCSALKMSFINKLNPT